MAALLLMTTSQVLTWAAGLHLQLDAATALRNIQSADSALTNLFSSCAGYAVFPRVRNAGAPLGTEHYTGILYQCGEPIGRVEMEEAKVSPKAASEPFYEIIFFETIESLANFKQGHLELSADANAIAAAEGAALKARYREGVLVFTLPRSGLMAEIVIGDQKFRFEPLNLSRGNARIDTASDPAAP